MVAVSYFSLLVDWGLPVAAEARLLNLPFSVPLLPVSFSVDVNYTDYSRGNESPNC